MTAKLLEVGARDAKGGKVFLSHSSTDATEVEALRAALDRRGIACFLDVLELKAGDALAATLKDQVQAAPAFVVVLSPAAISSKWVRQEIEWALGAEDLATETGARFRFLPVFTGGITHGFLEWLRRPEVLGIDANGRALADVANQIAQALGVLPVDARPPSVAPPLAPIAELTLDFHDLSVEVRDDKERVRGRVRVEYQPPTGPRGGSVTYPFESPLGPLELGELRWYVETWPSWSFGNERLKRATEVEEALPRWGRALFDVSLSKARTPVDDFERGPGERRIVVQVPAAADVTEAAIDGAELARRVAENGAAARLLALPWELLRGPRGFLFEGRHPIRVVRRLPRKGVRGALEPTRHILRVLLLVARASDAPWIDPRVSLTPLVTALAPLGDRVEVIVPPDGSFTALAAALVEAERQGRPFHVVHFDGHGIYDLDKGLGQLVFEDDTDCAAGKIARKTRRVDATVIGGLLRDHRIPLFVLEACHSAQADAQVTSSVAAELVEAGIGSVVAMSYSVLVETARRFVDAFYPSLARGERIGTAMVHAQAALAHDPDRSPHGLPRWEMHDWFVPVLFQEADGDIRLLPEADLPQASDVELVQRTARGKTPDAPAHGFVGRDRGLLALSRLLDRHRVVLLRGTGGLGKTALAAECARWLLDMQRVRRVAWTSVETFGSAEAVLQDLGGQIVAGFAVSRFGSLDEARHELERPLRDRPALFVIDNFESVAVDPDPALVPMVAALAAVGETRVLFTSREPAPAELGAVELGLGALSAREGRELVEQVLRREAQAPREERGDSTDASWIDELVESVAGHPRSLVLLAPMVAGLGARVTREKLVPFMADLDRRNPGNRENSLFASVRLSLARLEPKQREQVRALGVFHGAAHTAVLSQVLDVEPGETVMLCRELVNLGLARANGLYLVPDPALGLAVASELGEQERARLESRWLEASLGWVGHLYEQRSKDTSIAAAGVREALEELLAVVVAVERAANAGTLSIEEASEASGLVEQLLTPSGNARALGLVVAARERLGRRLAGWSGAAFATHRLAIERQMEAGDLATALTGAQVLRERARSGGPGAYEDAAYDIAASSLLLSLVLYMVGRADDALVAATEAESRFRALVAAGHIGAATMATTSLGHRGNALLALGRLDEAAAAYEKAIEEAGSLGARRAEAVNRGELGTVRMRQERYPEAIAAFHEARRTFEDLGEPSSVAHSWLMIAMVHRGAGQLDLAERANLRSLEIETRIGNRTGQAATLNELGLLFNAAGRLEESAEHHRRAADLYAKIGDQRLEGGARTCLADRLRGLSQYAQARTEAQRAVDLRRTFGHDDEPWTTWAVLSTIEHDLGNADEAAIAREQAIDTYAAYRRAGGAAQRLNGQLVDALTDALASGVSPLDLASKLPSTAAAKPSIVAFFDRLRAILAGARDPALLADPGLDYDDVVELTRLLEHLERMGDS